MGRAIATIAAGTLCCGSCTHRGDRRRAESSDAGRRLSVATVERRAVDAGQASPVISTEEWLLDPRHGFVLPKPHRPHQEPAYQRVVPRDLQRCLDARTGKRGGSVRVQFTIAASGRVIAAVVAESSLVDPATERCLVQVVRRWKYPKPRGAGLVITSHTFDLPPLPD